MIVHLHRCYRQMLLTISNLKIYIKIWHSEKRYDNSHITFKIKPKSNIKTQDQQSPVLSKMDLFQNRDRIPYGIVAHL